jgi:hypothetical protein
VSVPATPPTASSLPGYRRILGTIGGLYVLLGGSMLVRGATAAMQPFGVPEAVLDSAHFGDFFHWVFVHMSVLGVLFVLLARFVTEARAQRSVARVLLLLELHYTYLDLRTSDSPFGNGLYQGGGSLVPPLIDLIVVACFAYLATRRVPADAQSPSHT